MNIVIADDHPFTLAGISSYLIFLGHTVVDCCHNGIAAWNAIRLLAPEVAILDIGMPGMNGLTIAGKVQHQKLATKVVLLTRHNEHEAYKQAIVLGVFGYLLKNFPPSELEACLKAIAANKHYVSCQLEKELVHKAGSENRKLLSALTFTERKVLKMISQQKSTKQIALLLFSGEKTIETHRHNIIEKLHLPNEKNQLLMWAIQHKDLFC